MPGISNYLGTALGAYQTLSGVTNTNRANTEALNLERTKPIKKTSQYDRNALSFTESELANGMSAEASQAYEDGLDRSLSSSISAILKSGGNVNNIGDMYGNTLQGRQQLAVIRDQMRMNKVNAYLSQLDKMAEDEEKNWLVNEYGPYINKIKAVGEAKRAAAEQTAKGMDTVFSSLGGMGGGGKAKTATTDVSDMDFSGGGNEAWGNYNQTNGFNSRSLGFTPGNYTG